MNGRWPFRLLLCAAMAVAAAEKPAPELGPLNTMFRADPDIATLLSQAGQLAESRQFRTAAELYQGLIEKGGDRAVASTRGGNEFGTGGAVWLPVAVAARDALVSGPAELRAEYTARYEAVARRLVDDALAAHDGAALRRVAGRFPITPAAQRARAWSAVLAADQCLYAAAASDWDEFLTLQPILGDGGMDLALALAQHAIALAKAGEPDGAKIMAARLANEFSKAVRHVGGRDQDVSAFVIQTLGGLATRTPPPPPEPPAPTPRWMLPLVEGVSEHATTHGGRVYIRTSSEVTCIELASGKRLWGAVAPVQARSQGGGSRSSREGADTGGSDVPRYAVEAAAGRVFYVENFPSAQRLFEVGAMPGFGGRGGRPVMQRYASSSHLTARNAATGRREWRVGCGEGSDEFVRAARWVSKSLAVGDRVLVIAVHIQSYHLVCLDAADGRLIWRSFISQRPDMGHGWPGQTDLDRPSPPCIAGNRVVCLTNAGAMGCFDLQTGEPLWLLQYQAKPPHPAGRGNVFVAGNAGPAPAAGGKVNPVLATRTMAWAAPADSEELLALDIVAGRLVWSAPRQGMQILLGLAPGGGTGTSALAILASPGVQAVRVEDGQVAWTATLESPCGRPVLRGTDLFVLQGGNGVVRLDAQTGRRVAQAAVAADGFRHLAGGSPSWVLLGDRVVAGLGSLGEAMDVMARRIEAEPGNARWRRERGELRLQAGEWKDALDDLMTARALETAKAPADAATTALLFRCHLALAAVEKDKALAWLDRAAAFAASAAARSERLFALAGAHEALKAPAKAADALQMILDRESEAWMPRSQVAAQDGSVVAAGRVSNRALALQRLERLVGLYGAAVCARAETAAQRRLADARAHGDVRALDGLIELYPFGVAQEQARLLLARHHFDAQEYDAAIELLERMLRGVPRIAREADAALGLALAGVRANRGGVARSALASLERVPPAARAGFAGTTGKARDLAGQLRRELPPVVSRGTGGESKAPAHVKPMPVFAGGAVDIGGDRLVYDPLAQAVLRVGSDGDRVAWASAPGVVKIPGGGAVPEAASFGDTVVVCGSKQLVALDADTGRLLWENTITPRVALSNAARFRQVALRGGAVIMGDGGERAGGNASVIIVDGQLILAERRAVAGISPRRATNWWSVDLPGPEPAWAGAQTRTTGRWLAVASADPTGPEGRTVAVVDVRHGKLFALWNLPQNSADFTLREDGCVVVGP